MSKDVPHVPTRACTGLGYPQPVTSAAIICSGRTQQLCFAASCEDQSDDSFSCSKLLQGYGLCSNPRLASLCPVTCSLCSKSASEGYDLHPLYSKLCAIVPEHKSVMRFVSAGKPAAWTVMRAAGQVCLATQAECNRATHCGDPIQSLHECTRAGAALNLAQGVVQLNSTIVPKGCFTERTGNVYFNVAKDKAGPARNMFAKSICGLKNVTTTKLAAPTVENVTVCGATSLRQTYDIPAEQLDLSIKQLINDCLGRSCAVRIQEGTVELTSDWGLPYSLDLALLGQPWQAQLEPSTKLNLNLHHINIVSGDSPTTFCLENLLLRGGKVHSCCILCQAHCSAPISMRLVPV